MPLKKTALCLIVAVAASQASAGDDAVERASSTAFASIDYGLTTQKSELAASNDTGGSLRYTLGFHAGAERTVGVLLRSDSSAINYELNGSSTTSANQDFIIRYRWGNFFIGAIVASTALEATRADATENAEIDAVGTGFGGHFATVWGIGRSATWYLDTAYNTYGQTREENQIDMSFASRMDVDSGVRFHLTRDVLDLAFGYRHRISNNSIAGTALVDTVTSTYLGLRFNASF